MNTHRSSIPDFLMTPSSFVTSNKERRVASVIREAMHNAYAYSDDDIKVNMFAFGHKINGNTYLTIIHSGKRFSSIEEIQESLKYGRSGGNKGVQGSGMKFSQAVLFGGGSYHCSATILSSKIAIGNNFSWKTYKAQSKSETEPGTQVIEEFNGIDFDEDILAYINPSCRNGMNVAYTYPVDATIFNDTLLVNKKVFSWVGDIVSPKIYNKINFYYTKVDIDAKSKDKWFNPISRSDYIDSITISSKDLNAKDVVWHMSGEQYTADVRVKIRLLADISTNRNGSFAINGTQQGKEQRGHEAPNTSVFAKTYSKMEPRKGPNERSSLEPSYARRDNRSNYKSIQNLGLPYLSSNRKANDHNEISEMFGFEFKGDIAEYKYCPRLLVNFEIETHKYSIFGSKDAFFWLSETGRIESALDEISEVVGEKFEEEIADWVKSIERYLDKPDLEEFAKIDRSIKYSPVKDLCFVDLETHEKCKAIKPGGVPIKGYFKEDGSPVLNRVDLRGKERKGIDLTRTDQNLKNGSPIYTLYVHPMTYDSKEIDRETYRNHVSAGEIENLSPRPKNVLLSMRGRSEGFRMDPEIDIPNGLPRGVSNSLNPVLNSKSDTNSNKSKEDYPYFPYDSEELLGGFNGDQLLLNKNNKTIAMVSKAAVEDPRLRTMLSNLYNYADGAIRSQYKIVEDESNGEANDNNKNIAQSGIEVLVNSMLQIAFNSKEAKDLMKKIS